MTTSMNITTRPRPLHFSHSTRPSPLQFRQRLRPVPLQLLHATRSPLRVLKPSVQKEQREKPRPWQSWHWMRPRPRQFSHCCMYSVWGTVIRVVFSVNIVGAFTAMSHGWGGTPLLLPSS